jgi:hypothetical protein
LSEALAYSREELDWVEAEWAFHLHGRSAFMSREDYLQLRAWAGEGVPADALVNAMEAYFQRRAKRGRQGGFTALSHLARDVAKAMKLRAALARAEGEAAAAPDQRWAAVKEPLRSDPRGRVLFEAWQRLRRDAPAPDAPGFLEHFDAERKAFRELAALAEQRLGPAAEPLRADLGARLRQSGLEPDSLVWRRAWEHHWGRILCEAWGIES